jgi:hypothetical protein
MQQFEATSPREYLTELHPYGGSVRGRAIRVLVLHKKESQQ